MCQVPDLVVVGDIVVAQNSNGKMNGQFRSGTLGRMLGAVLLGISRMEQETRRERQASGIADAKRKASPRAGSQE
jgi:DNA invertase Pin-like site-specific DNA recombinase